MYAVLDYKKLFLTQLQKITLFVVLCGYNIMLGCMISR